MFNHIFEGSYLSGVHVRKFIYRIEINKIIQFCYLHVFAGRPFRYTTHLHQTHLKTLSQNICITEIAIIE